jgi:hypothetical protein
LKYYGVDEVDEVDEVGTIPVTLLLRVVSQLSVDQYFSAWTHFKAPFVLYTFDE